MREVTDSSYNVIDKDVQTSYTYTIRNTVFPIWITPTGRCYIIRTTEAGNQYKQYLPYEVCLQICAEMNINKEGYKSHY